MSKSSARERILVVDDDADIRLAMEMSLTYHGYEVLVAKDGEEALARLAKERDAGASPALVITDLKMPRLDGMGLLERLQGSGLPVVVVSGHGDVATAVEAVKKGASNFLEKPLDEQRVMVTVRAALRERRLAEENTRLRAKLAGAVELGGSSPLMKRLAAQVSQAARSDSSVLITGENGAGKEVVARALHAASPRADGPFVVVNCAAIPEDLVESELYGHEKGAYTGAHERRMGHFEAADEGTLFLDEIGDMPLAAQAKLLRSLEQREIVRVGGVQPISVDIRVLAATNADLEAAVQSGAFRMDLYYRLAVVPLRVPPLRERPEDVPQLAQRFLAQVAARDGRRPQALDESALAFLALRCSTFTLLGLRSFHMAVWIVLTCLPVVLAISGALVIPCSMHHLADSMMDMVLKSGIVGCGLASCAFTSCNTAFTSGFITYSFSLRLGLSVVVTLCPT